MKTKAFLTSVSRRSAVKVWENNPSRNIPFGIICFVKYSIRRNILWYLFFSDKETKAESLCDHSLAASEWSGTENYSAKSRA